MVSRNGEITRWEEKREKDTRIISGGRIGCGRAFIICRPIAGPSKPQINVLLQTGKHCSFLNCITTCLRTEYASCRMVLDRNSSTCGPSPVELQTSCSSSERGSTTKEFII